MRNSSRANLCYACLQGGGEASRVKGAVDFSIGNVLLERSQKKERNAAGEGLKSLVGGTSRPTAKLSGKRVVGLLYT